MVSESNVIFGVYIAYALTTIFVLSVRPSRRTALTAIFVGWLFLPVEVFPPETITAQNFTVDFIGTALPSNALVTKTWVVPLVVFVGLIVAMPRKLAEFRPKAVDLGMMAFCLSPVLPLIAGKLAASAAMAQFLYLSAAWGGTWMVGRILLGDAAGRAALTDAIAFSGILLLPVAIVEGMSPAWLYTAAYGPHPFQLEGADRYFGFRPLGFFEHGNQFGIWMAIAALAAVYRCVKRTPRRGGDIAVAAILMLASFASQSAGAVLLLLLGCVWLVLTNRMRRLAVIAAGLFIAIGGTAYVSGKLPVERWALQTPAGQSAVAALRGVGRLSLAYRVRRDQMALPIILREPLTGYGTWEWWRPMKSRPWGLPLLVAGQYGVISLTVLMIVLMVGSVRRIGQGRSTVLAAVVIVAAVDAWLNSFIYFPAILAAAALASSLRRSSPGAEDRTCVTAHPAATILGSERSHAS